MNPLRFACAATALALAAGAFSAASHAAPHAAAKVGKDERLTCSALDDGRIVVTNSSIYYLLKGAKLHLSYRVVLPGPSNRSVEKKIVLTVSSLLAHDKSRVLGLKPPRKQVMTGCSAHVRKNDPNVTVGD